MSYSPPPAAGAELSRPQSPCAVRRLSWWERLAMVGSGGVLVALLVIAASLTPNPRGMGTHRQLGLPPCTVVAWYGIRCPSCGMTTSWSNLMHGRPVAALQANAGGVLLALAAIILGPWLLASGLAGRWLGRPLRETLVLAGGLLIVTVTLADWTLRLSLGW